MAAATQEATPGPVAVDVSDSQPADGITEKLRELTLAGGDLSRLGRLSGAELTAALKELGFNGLKTRKAIESELQAWQARQ